MNSGRTRVVPWAVLLIFSVHGAAWAALFVGIFIFVPRLEKIFVDFQMRLPAISECTFMITRARVNGVYLILFLAALYFLVDVLIYLYLHRKLQSWKACILWSVIMLALPLLLGLFLAASYGLGMMKLNEALRK